MCKETFGTEYKSLFNIVLRCNELSVQKTWRGQHGNKLRLPYCRGKFSVYTAPGYESWSLRKISKVWFLIPFPEGIVTMAVTCFVNIFGTHAWSYTYLMVSTLSIIEEVDENFWWWSLCKKNNKGTLGCSSLHLFAIHNGHWGGREGNFTPKSQLSAS